MKNTEGSQESPTTQDTPIWYRFRYHHAASNPVGGWGAKYWTQATIADLPTLIATALLNNHAVEVLPQSYETWVETSKAARKAAAASAPEPDEDEDEEDDDEDEEDD